MNKNNILLSIIIPHYNSVGSLEKLLSTIPKKKEIEIIVIDDRSSNGIKSFKSLMSEYKNCNVTALYNTGEKGAGACRNIGLNRARGKWILFADADDFFIDGFFEKIKPYLFSEYDVVYFTPTSQEIDTNIMSDRHLRYAKILHGYLENSKHENEIKVRYNFPVPWSKLIRTSFIKEQNILFDEVIASNDIMFSTKVGYYMKHFKVTSDIIYCVTRSSGTLTMKKNEAILDARIEAYIRWDRFLKSRLSQKDYKLVEKTARGYVYDTYKRKYGLRKVIDIYMRFRKNGIKIFNKELLNPILMYKKIRHHKIRNQNQKKFMS